MIPIEEQIIEALVRVQRESGKCPSQIVVGLKTYKELERITHSHQIRALIAAGRMSRQAGQLWPWIEGPGGRVPYRYDPELKPEWAFVVLP